MLDRRETIALNLLFGTIALLFLLPAILMGQERPATPVEALLITSDIHQHAGQLTKGIQAGFEHGLSSHRRLQEMPQSTVIGLRAALKTAFAPERFEQEILKGFKLTLSNDDINNITTWMDSATGRKIAQLEAAPPGSDHGKDLQQFQSHLQAEPAVPHRITRMDRLDSASKTTQTRVNVVLKGQLAVAMVLVEHLPDGKKPTTEALSMSIETSSRGLIEAAMRRETQLLFLYTYQSLTTAELDRYVAFAASPSGTRYYDAIATGINAALTAGSHQWRQMIATILHP